MRDIDQGDFTDAAKNEIVGVIEQMTTIHDKDNDGLDFLELYTASGGKLQDL